MIDINSNTNSKFSLETIFNLRKVNFLYKLIKACLKQENFKFSKFIDNLNKLAISDNLINFLQDEFSKVDEGTNTIHSILLIFLYKFNPDIVNILKNFNELNFLKLFLKKNLSELDEIKNTTMCDIKNTTLNNLMHLNYIICLIYMLVLKFKYSIINYMHVELIIKIKSFFTEDIFISITDKFLKLYLNVNNIYNINYIENLFSDDSEIYKFFIFILSPGGFPHSKFEPIIKTLKSFSTFPQEAPTECTDSFSSGKIIFLDGHKQIYQKVKEIYNYNNEAKLLFYGPHSCGKSTFSKIFTKDEIIIDIDESIEVGSLLGGYLINEFSEIIWQDGLLLKALKEKRDIIFRNMEKCGNEFFFVLKQIIEKNSFFLNIKQEVVKFENMPRLIFIYNSSNKKSALASNDLIFNFLVANTFSFEFESYNDSDKIKIALNENVTPEFRKLNQQFNILEKILETYQLVTKKFKFNTRFRELNLYNLIKFTYRVEKILSDIVSNNCNIIQFLSEKNKMKIISTFLFMNFFTLDDFNLIKKISDEFSNNFNFDSTTFSNSILNFQEMEMMNNIENEYSYIKNFQYEKLYFENLSNCEYFYSYNSNSKCYTKLINESVLNVSKENILLVGETGVGKTTMIQNLAKVMSTKLNVINLSQSSDISELFGGFKPIHSQIFLGKYFEKIVDIIQTNFNKDNNSNFLNSFYEAYSGKDINYFLKFCFKSLEKIEKKIPNNVKIIEIRNELLKFKKALKRGCYNAFTYIDGILLDALKKDEWILLDEINLANDDLLLKLTPILEGQDIFIVENNQLKVYKRGPNFRIFGSMNPEYNIGKKRLPTSIRGLFTELFIHEINSLHDIKTFVKTYLNNNCDDKYISEITKFYLLIKDKQSNNEIQKQNFAKCNFSLRNLSRALITIKNACKFYDIQTCILEALHMNFLSLLNENSISTLIKECSILHRIQGQRKVKLPLEGFIHFDNYFIKKEYSLPQLIDSDIDQKFILTKTFKKHLENLLRIISLSDYAVLLEGPTSVGKTSIIEYIGKKIGQKILRINNNQNTEIEEYIGNYMTDSKGQFYFQEGFLTKAVKEGSWIILDEINLAPSEVLEALNRLLDDNRELFISELNTTVKAHPNFKIFAAMNPSELYGGRKDLSEAFKNRFIHLYFDNIPEEDLEEIIEKRCKLPKSRVKLMVQIFNDLQKIRSTEKVFSKKEGFITIRDLLKWGSRNINSYDDLAYEGFFVIAEKIRNNDEKLTVQKIIEKNIQKYSKNLKFYFEKYFNEYVTRNFNFTDELCLTYSSKRLITLIDKCLRNREPVLLIGETGTGKTAICEFLANSYSKELVTINCHESIDTSDFLGSLRSVFGRQEKISKINKLLEELISSILGVNESENKNININIKLKEKLEKFYTKFLVPNIPIPNTKCEDIIKLLNKVYLGLGLGINQNIPPQLTLLNSIFQESHKLFEWIDGPLTESMKKGKLLLIDEISLVQDSVLERMNSVFEADRVLVLSEKQSSHVEIIYPHEAFMVIASMNPSGDHGKRELSPALRSRFSEIFIMKDETESYDELAKKLNEFFESRSEYYEYLNTYYNESISNITTSSDLFKLIDFKIKKSSLAKNLNLQFLLFDFTIWYNYYVLANNSQIIKLLTLRDIDMLIDFISIMCKNSENILNFISIYQHSIEMTVIDGLFLNESSKPEALQKIKEKISNFLLYQMNYLIKIHTNGILQYDPSHKYVDSDQKFGISPLFVLNKGVEADPNVKFVFNTNTLQLNILKILRGLSTNKPILIEGSPGVGKTTIVQNLAKKLGKKAYRINLSEHTDMIDLIGSEYPTDSDGALTFKWVDGVFLKALVNGDWLIIDEMNLASQSILEGLNSVLDHRKSLFVSELNKEFKCHPDFQIFATQNPVNQGGGRKFLPKSFLNRFVKIYLDDLKIDDYQQILMNLYDLRSENNTNIIMKLTSFNAECQKIVYEKYKLNINEVGEFNLRTLTKVLDICKDNEYGLIEILKLVYISRIRNKETRKEIRKIMNEIFESEGVNDKSIKGRPEQTVQKITYPYIENSNISECINFNTMVIRKYFSKLLICVRNNLPVILTGTSGVGKKEIIRYLARKTNNNLFEFCLNSSMDSTELLGNFDKVSLSWQINKIRRVLSDHISIDSSNAGDGTRYLQLLNLVDFINKNIKETEQLYENLNNLVEKLNSLNILHLVENEVKSAFKTLESIRNETFNFEWHDSTLIQCIENGDWIILDNVNTCSAAVLDRLNSLLDDDKQIYLNECGSVEARIVRPHFNFRIFMVMNEKFGEVSRALKNRCVEIYIDNKFLAIDTVNNDVDKDITLPLYKFVSFSNCNKKISFKVNEFSKSVRKTTFDDLILICRNKNIFSYVFAFKLSVVFIFVNSKKFIDFRLFKKFVNLFDYFYSKKGISFTHVLSHILNIMNFDQIYPDNIFNQIESENSFETSLENSFETNLLPLICKVNQEILIFKFKLDLPIDTNKYFLIENLINNYDFINSFMKDYNDLTRKISFFLELLDDNFNDNPNNHNSLKKNENMRMFNDIIILNHRSNIHWVNNTFKYSLKSESYENIKEILDQIDKKKLFIQNIMGEQEWMVFLLSSILMNKTSTSTLISISSSLDKIIMNKQIFQLLENHDEFRKFSLCLESDGTGHEQLLEKYFLRKLNLKNSDKLLKKLISAKYEPKIDHIFEIFNLTTYRGEDSVIYISLIQFILFILDNSEYIKFIQMNTETFLFVFENIVNKYLGIRTETTQNNRNENLLFKIIYKRTRKLFNNNSITDVDTSEINLFNTITSPRTQKMILLEYDIKSAKTFNDLINLNYYNSFIEKVNETLTNEKLFLPIINSKEDMMNIQTFMDNLINHCSYINDFSFVDTGLVQMHIFKKYNARNSIDSRIYAFNLKTCNEQLRKLSNHLVILLLMNEYTGQNCLEKIKFINNQVQPINEHLQNNYRKLFLVPFYYFFSKIHAENILFNYEKILKLNNSREKIKKISEIFYEVSEFIMAGIEQNKDDFKFNLKNEIDLTTLIINSEFLVRVSIPDKNTISKILGKDLFQLFYKLTIENKEKLFFSQKLIENLENYSNIQEKQNKNCNIYDTESIKSYERFTNRLQKMEKDINRNNNSQSYDFFLKDLSTTIENFVCIKNNRQKQIINLQEIEELKLNLKSLINKYILYFGDIILPFSLSLLIYTLLLEESYRMNPQIRSSENSSSTSPPFLNNFTKSNSSLQNEILELNEIYRLPLFTTEVMISLLEKVKSYVIIPEIISGREHEHGLNNLNKMIAAPKIYEDLNMKVLESTFTLSDMPSSEREKLKEIEEKREIEENFPQYKDEFVNFDSLALIELTKNINVKIFYKNANNETKPIENKNLNEKLYLTYKILEKSFEEFKLFSSKSTQVEKLSMNYYYSNNFINILQTEEKASQCISSDISYVLENFYYFYKLKSIDEIDLSGINSANQEISEIDKKYSSNYSYSFYKDTNPNEMKFLYIALNKLLDKACFYLENLDSHSQHPLLVLIIVIIVNLLELNINSTPLSKALTGLDILLSKLNEWETYASKKLNSFNEEIKNLMAVIRRFRKIEILSWRSLLNAKMKEYEEKDCQNYFETILSYIWDDHTDENSMNHLETLNIFILNSNLASFKFRINCLLILKNFLLIKYRDISREGRIVDRSTLNSTINSLSNMYNYYQSNFIFSEKFNMFKANQISEIEMKVKDLVNIAKWDIKNYFNFRDNMRRNYKQLNKILKGFDCFCLTNIKEFIEFSREDYINKEYVFTKLIEYSSGTPLETTEEENIIFDVICNEIHNRLNSVKNLDKVFKHKALIDMIKSLKELGFSSIYKFYQNEVYSQFKSYDLNFIIKYEKWITDDNTIGNIKKSSATLYKILEKINNLNITDSINEDLNLKYLENMKGLSFSAFFKSLSVFGNLRKLIKIYKRLVIKNSNITSDIEFNTFDSHKELCCSVDRLLISVNMNNINPLFECKDSNNKLMESLLKLKLIKDNYLEFLKFNSNYPSNNNLNNIHRAFTKEIKKIIEKEIMTIIKYKFTIIEYRIKDITIDLNKKCEEILKEISITDDLFENSDYDIYTSYIKYQTNKLGLSVSPALAINFESIDDFNQVLNNYITEYTMNSISISVFKIQQLSSIITSSSKVIYSLIKLTNLSVSIFYNVSINGFCQSKQSKITGEDNRVHEGGFGMSDGQGVEDVAKEIEDEEQLLGLKEKESEKEEFSNKNDKNDKSGKPDKNTGFETSTDFKEDQKVELSEDEDDNDRKSSQDKDDVEREKDSIEDARDNQMYNKENDIPEDDKNDKNAEEPERKVDLTDKSVSMNREQDSNFKAKEDIDKSKGKDREVEKPERKNEEENENEKNDENSNNQQIPDEKVEKLNVDEIDKKEDELNMDIEEESNMKNNDNEQEHEQDEEMKQEQAENNDTNMDNNPDINMDIDMDIDMDRDNKPEDLADHDDNDSQSEESKIKNFNGGEEINSEDEDEDKNKDEVFQSNPLATKVEDLGYNPISKNKGSSGNTARKTEENKDNNASKDREENGESDKNQLDQLDRYEEINDLNSILESVWMTRPSLKKSKEINKTVDNRPQVPQSKEEEIKDFDFHNFEGENENENDKNSEIKDFDQGYADNEDDNNKKASGINKLEDNQEFMNNKDRERDNKIKSDSDITQHRKSPEEIIKGDKNLDRMIIDEFNEESLNEIDVENENDQNEVEDDYDLDRYINQGKESTEVYKPILEMDKDIGSIIDENEKNYISIFEEDDLIKKLESEMLSNFQTWTATTDNEIWPEMWNKLEHISINSINKLIQQLKIALEPNKQTKLRGNYKSGKRLNIKKIISFIASNYRNDKIWLRRTLPFERNYFVTIAIDDSLSMKEHNLGFFALESLVIVSTALSRAGIGKLCICAIKEDLEVYHNYTEVFNREKGAFVLSKFKFDFSSRMSHDLAMSNFMKNSMVMLENQLRLSQGGNASQIVFILSDGRFNKDNVRSICLEAKEKGLLYVFIILDKYGLDNNNSIMNMNSVKHVFKAEGDYDIEVKPYLDDFPFSYYVIVGDSSDLPDVIHTILVKWFSLNQ